MTDGQKDRLSQNFIYRIDFYPLHQNEAPGSGRWLCINIFRFKNKIEKQGGSCKWGTKLYLYATYKSCNARPSLQDVGRMMQKSKTKKKKKVGEEYEDK